MTKTVNTNYGSIGSPGNTFDRRISADSDTFGRNDIDAVGMALDDHTHNTGLGLPVNTIPSGGLTVTLGGLTVSAGGITVTGTSTIAGSFAAGTGGQGVSLSTSSPAPTSGVLIGGANVATAGTLSLGTTNPALGGGAAATLGTIGGSGPATAAQNSWLQMGIGNANIWVPVWK